jgi:hypothetical protein
MAQHVVSCSGRRYLVRITRRGRSNRRFGWEICREDNCLVVDRSIRTYPTRAQAVIASANAASRLVPVGRTERGSPDEFEDRRHSQTTDVRN